MNGRYSRAGGSPSLLKAEAIDAVHTFFLPATTAIRWARRGSVEFITTAGILVAVAVSGAVLSPVSPDRGAFANQTGAKSSETDIEALRAELAAPAIAPARRPTDISESDGNTAIRVATAVAKLAEGQTTPVKVEIVSRPHKGSQPAQLRQLVVPASDGTFSEKSLVERAAQLTEQLKAIQAARDYIFQISDVGISKSQPDAEAMKRAEQIVRDLVQYDPTTSRDTEKLRAVLLDATRAQGAPIRLVTLPKEDASPGWMIFPPAAYAQKISYKIRTISIAAVEKVSGDTRHQ